MSEILDFQLDVTPDDRRLAIGVTLRDNLGNDLSTRVQR